MKLKTNQIRITQIISQSSPTIKIKMIRHPHSKFLFSLSITLQNTGHKYTSTPLLTPTTPFQIDTQSLNIFRINHHRMDARQSLVNRRHHSILSHQRLYSQPARKLNRPHNPTRSRQQIHFLCVIVICKNFRSCRLVAAGIILRSRREMTIKQDEPTALSSAITSLMWDIIQSLRRST